MSINSGNGCLGRGRAGGDHEEITANMSHLSQGIAEVENVARSSTVSGEVAKDIDELNQSAGEMSNRSSRVSMRTKELGKLAEQLKEMVVKFRI